VSDSPANDAPFRLIDDVEFGEDVTVWSFSNLYGCRIGSHTRIGSFVALPRAMPIGPFCEPWWNEAPRSAQESSSSEAFESGRERSWEPAPWSRETLLRRPSWPASHGAWARLEHRRTGSREELGEGRSLDCQRTRLRERVHRNLPELAMYATCVVLACVIGASIALYLN
jgi:hypothetical protein